MKKILLTILSFALGASAYAQIINLDFETWTSQGNPPYDKAGQWSTFNDALYPLVTTYTASKSTDKHGGQYAMSLQTKVIPPNNDTLGGAAVFGSITFNPNTQAITIKGKPFNQRPSGLSGYYKYSTPGLDAPLMAIIVTKWNGTGRDTLGQGWGSGTPTLSYTSFTTSVTYNPNFNGINPDTLIIFFASSTTDVPGSTLLVDDISMIGVDLSSVQQFFEPSESYSVYPNPARDVLNISAAKMGMNRNFIMFDAVGREVVNMKIEDMNTSISLHNLPEGLFFYKIISSGNNQVISSGKFNILR